MPSTESRPIVLFDDSEDDILVLKRLFEKAGVEDPLVLFTNGAEALKYLGRVATGGFAVPLLCLIDIRMPTYTGYDILEALRASEVFDSVPAMMLSFSDARRDIERSMAKGAQGYFVKFPSAETLRCVVEEARVYPRKRGTVENPSFKIRANLLRG